MAQTAEFQGRKTFMRKNFKGRRWEIIGEPAWFNRVAAQAYKRGLSFAEYVRRAVTSKLERDEARGT